MFPRDLYIFKSYIVVVVVVNIKIRFYIILYWFDASTGAAVSSAN